VSQKESGNAEKFYCVGYTARVWYLPPSGISALQIRILKWKNDSTTGY